MRKVKLTKTGRVDKPAHPHEHLQTGEERIGLMVSEPEIGSRFMLLPTVEDTKGLLTSPVQKLVSKQIFETYNTIYKLEFIND